jgi:DNA-binding transcriptional LysR family regulator
MARPTLRQLRTFLAVVEIGNISTAARSLNLTQPAASQQLRELERVLRVRLLERAAGKVQPTAAGVALFEPARRAQAAIEDAVAVVAAHRQGETGLSAWAPARQLVSTCCRPSCPRRNVGCRGWNWSSPPATAPTWLAR